MIWQMWAAKEQAMKGVLCSQAFHSSSAASLEEEQARQRLKTCRQNAELGKSICHPYLAVL